MPTNDGGLGYAVSSGDPRTLAYDRPHNPVTNPGWRGFVRPRRWAMSDLTETLDLACWSARDVLTLVAAVRLQAERDPLGALADCVLDLVADEA